MNPTSSIQDLKAFLDAFADKERSLRESRLTLEKAALRNTLEGFALVNRFVKRERKRTAPDLNIFDIIKLNRGEEEGLHTPMLGWLLDPRANHDQGHLFYDRFIEFNGWEETVFAQPDSLTVRQEVGTGLGRVDLLLQGHKKLERFAMVIENKPKWAIDQHTQMERYYKYLTDVLGLPPSNIKLIYLTPVGSQPADHSMNLPRQQDLTHQGVLHCLSYHHHISKWLDASEVEPPNLQCLLEQYQRAIAQL